MRRALLAVVTLAAATLAGCSVASHTTPTHDVPAYPRAAATKVAAVAPAAVYGPAAGRAPVPPNPCARNAAGQLVRVSLHRQRLWMCSRHRLVRSSPITSGIVGQYTSTPTGDYVIQGATRDTTLTLITGQTYAVKYWIPFDGPLFGFHDSSWQTFPYGSTRYRTEGSHGCVHLPLKTIAFLYRWASVGTPVRIRA